MKVKILIILYLLGQHFCKAQSHWETVHTFSKDAITTAPLVWQYKDKLYLYTDKENAAILKERGPDFLVPFSSDEKNGPEARKDAMQWATDEGLWLFGGISSSTQNLLNDLWFYDFKASRWKLFESQELSPRPIRGAAVWSTSDALWMFGGAGNLSENNSMGLLNEMWRFDLKDKNWEIVKTENTPSPRTQMAYWPVDKVGLIIYGGYGSLEDEVRSGGLAELWQFSFESLKWNLIEDNGLFSKISFGSQKMKTHPGYRVKPLFWSDSNGGNWLVFGQSSIGYNAISIDPYLWCYNLKEKAWNYKPVNVKSSIIGASSLFQNDQQEISLVFPYIINEKTMEVQNSSVLKLISKN